MKKNGVLRGARPQQAQAQQRPRAEIEGPACLFGAVPLDLALPRFRREPAQVEQFDRHLAALVALDPRRAVRLSKSGPEHFVAPDDLAQGRAEDWQIQVPREPHAGSNIVSGARPVHAVQKPEPLLREGKRRPAEIRPADNSRRRIRLRLLFFEEQAEELQVCLVAQEKFGFHHRTVWCCRARFRSSNCCFCSSESVASLSAARSIFSICS